MNGIGYINDPRRRARTVHWSLAVLLALLGAHAASAAPGFIAGSFVDSDGLTARVSLQFRCGVEYVRHEPVSSGDSLRIRIESTGICSGASPNIAFNREQHRPIGADDAKLVSVEYDGDSPGGHIVRFDFSEEVHFEDVRALNDNTIMVQISLESAEPVAKKPETGSTGRLVRRAAPALPKYVINLESSLRPPATADMPTLKLPGKNEVFVTQATIDGRTWYRIRVGYFDTADQAAQTLRQLRGQFPTAWIDRAGADPDPVAAVSAPAAERSVDPVAPEGASSEIPATVEPVSEIAQLMQEARRLMMTGELSRAIQIYTKVLQQPPNEYQRDAQEYLALARERNGQLAHAKAEYQRYLSVYPDGEGADRVRQRLSAMLASGAASSPTAVASSDTRSPNRRSAEPEWKVRTFATQFYRRDANQLNDEDQVISQSSVYSDISIDARRRGERFDFSARLTGGHRYDMLDETQRETDDVRLSYAYADLADTKTRLRGRLGRQTRNSGGVLGRFDGLNLTYGLTERVQLEAVFGKPVYSTADGVDDERSFYGLSTNFGPIGDNLDIRVFALQQDIEGLDDRQSIGGEVRYFGETRSVWGMVDYDTAFKEIGSAFLQGSWRLPSKLTLTGLVDHRQSPYLSLGNAMIGQFVDDFATLQILFTEEEIRRLALDRSAATTTVTLGLSKALTPKLQLGLNATQSTVEATPESGGVPANPESEYGYYSVDLVASSLFTERDVSIFSFRYSESDSANVYTVNLDSRFRIGRAWRLSPRLRVDYREITTDDSRQWTYTPGLRLDYRWGKKVRFELTAGKQFSAREMTDTDQDRESYYVTVGYQLFF